MARDYGTRRSEKEDISARILFGNEERREGSRGTTETLQNGNERRVGRSS